MDEKKQSMEIDVIGLIRRVLKEKKLLGVYLAIGTVVGLIVAFNTPRRYTSQVVLAPELGGAGSMADNLSDLASMVGVNMSSSGNNVDAIYPEIYPDILASPDFIVRLFDVEVEQLKTHKRNTYFKHLCFEGKVPFWNKPKIALGKLLKKLRKKDNVAGEGRRIPFQMTEEEYQVVLAIRSLTTCLVDKKTSVITLGFTDQDPLVAAIMVDTIQSRIQQYITQYRTQKARNDLEYAERMYQEAMVKYRASQKAYSSFADSHRDMLLERYVTRRDELENEMQLNFNTANQFAQQMNVAQAKIQERTPAFTILQQAAIPVKPSSTPRLFILIAWIFLFAMADAAWVLFVRGWFRKRSS